MLPLHELWLAVSVPAGLAVAGTLVAAHLIGLSSRTRLAVSDPSPATSEESVARTGGGTAASTRAGDLDGPDPEAREWHAQAADLAAEVRRAVEAVDRPADLDRVSRRLLPLSSRMRGHVRRAPASVDATLHRRLYELAVDCQRVGIEHRPSPGSPILDDRLASLRASATDVEERVAATGQSKPLSNTEKAT